MEELFKAARTAMRNQMAQSQEASELDKEGLALAEKMMENAFKKDATVSEDMGQEVLGYISKAASVKKRGANPKLDPTPAISGPNAGKGNTRTPSNKSALDTLTGHTSKASNVIKKVLAPGNIEGIRQANKDGFQLTEEEINQKFDEAAKQAEITANDPAVKEKFRQLGIPEDTFTSLTSGLTSGIKDIAASNPGAAIVTAQKQMSEKQMSSLENPFGSLQSKIAVPDLGVKAGDPLAPGSDLLNKMKDKTGFSLNALSEKNPFGSMGVDFGNIQGAIASKVKGLGVPKDLGVNIPSLSSPSDIKAAGFADASQVPDIVNKGGFTDLAATVQKNESVPANIVPSTPVEEIGVPPDRPLQTLLYTTAHTSEEIELEFGATKREIGIIIVRWSGTTSDRRIESAKTYNEKVIERKGKSATVHYIILRDGTVQRILNTEVAPSLSAAKTATATGATLLYRLALDNIYASSIVVLFDAGYTCTEAEKNDKFLSAQSITSEQMDSYRMIAEAAVKAYPGAGHISMSLLAETIINKLGATGGGTALRLGPGFNADKYRDNLMVGANTNEYVEERR